MIKNILLVGLTFFKIYANAQNFSVTFGFPEVITSSGQLDPSNTPTLNGLQFGSFRAIGTSMNPNASGRFSFTNWPIGAANADNNYGNYTAVLSPTVFYEMSLFVNPGYTLNLTSLSFDVRRSGTGIRTYCVRSSLDNFTTNLSANTGTSTNLSVIPTDIFFWNFDSISTANDQRGSQLNFNSTFSALTDSLSLRFYAWNSESTGGSFSIDNVNIKGSVIDSLTLTSSQIALINKNTSLKMYPNPCVNDLLTISSEVAFSKLELIDMAGKIVYLKYFEIPQNGFKLNVVGFTKGVYTLRASFKSKSMQNLIVIEN